MKFLTILFCLTFSNSLFLDQPSKKLIVFTGSDWCPNCKQFDQSVLKDSLFLRFIQQNKIQLEIVDFPQRSFQSDSVKQENIKKADYFDFEGEFPSIYLFNLNDSSVRQIDYNRENPEMFCKSLLN
ncbi:MAG: thioredoxin family protein [Chitinophagaceae bacterium]